MDIPNYINELKSHTRINQKVNGLFSRANGLQCPWNARQIGLIIYLFASQGLVTYIQFADKNYNLALFIVNAVNFVFLVINGTIATYKDPTDFAIYHQRHFIKNG